MTNLLRTTTVLLLSAATACGGGVPVRLRIDNTVMRVDMAELVGSVESSLAVSGMLPAELARLPEVWPETMPQVQRAFALPVPAVPIDLSVEQGDPNYEQYKQVADVADAIRRIEINRLVLRVDQSTLSIPTPELALLVADKKDADPEDRRAWFRVGTLPAVPPGQVGDFDFQWAVGGESFLDAQLGDEERELAMRLDGRVQLDTAKDPTLPRGVADFRLIVVATFFVEPEKALDAVSGATE